MRRLSSFGRSLGFGLTLLALSRCGSDPDAPLPGPLGPGPLVDVQRYTLLEADEDPFADRPASFRCNEGGYHPEGDVYEIETDKCAYASVSQPSLRSIREGDRIRSLMWHQFLDADAPAEAHVALMIGSFVAWEKRITIPFPPLNYTFEWVAPADLPVGTAITIHCHNHGSNSYRFSVIEVVDSGSAP